MNFRRTLRNTILAGALALGIGSVARADESGNINKLPTTCSIPDQEIRRNEILPDGTMNTYTTWLGGDVRYNLVAMETDDPLVRLGDSYRVPLAREDFVEFVAADRESLFTDLNQKRNAELERKRDNNQLDYVAQYTSGISSLSVDSPLYDAARDRMLDGQEFPIGVNEATIMYWTKTKCFDTVHNVDKDVSVRFPITVYRAPQRVAAPVQRSHDRMGVTITGLPGDRNTPPPATAPQCSDGKDNDGDGKYDFPYDPGCTSDTDNKEKSWRDRRLHAQNIEQLPVHRELNVLIGGGVDQYTASDSIGTAYTPLDFDTKSIAARYRSLGEKTKVDAQVAVTQGDDQAGQALRTFNGEIHVDRKLFHSNLSPGISAALGIKDVRTYTNFWGEDSRQGNGYGFLGVNVTATADGGFASQNFAVLRAGVVAQPIIDKKLSFGNSAYESTTDMELAYPEFSLDARKSLGDRTYLDLQIRGAPKVETIYTSPANGRELMKTSEYLNLTVGLGYRFDKLDAYLQGKWAHNDETWNNIGTPGHPNTLKVDHNSLGVRGGITWTFDTN